MSSSSMSVADASSAELVAGIAALAAELAARPAPESGPACFAQTGILGRAVDLIESAIAARVDVADRSGQVAEWGHPSPTAWLRTTLSMRHVRAAERAVLAAQLPRLPRVAERLAAGELSVGYATAIAGGVRRLDEAECGKAEALLLEFVDQGHSVGQISRFTDKIEDLIAERNGTATEPEDGRRAERQWLAIHRSGTGAFVKGRFGAELTALIKAKLEPLTTPGGPEDARDHSERLADALQAYLSEGDRRWDPILVINLKPPVMTPPHPGAAATPEAAPAIQPEHARAVPPAHATAVPPACAPPAGAAAIPAGIADAELGWRPPAPTWPFDGTPFTTRLADGTPLPMQRAREILLNAGFSTLVLGTDGQPLYLGRRVRCASPAQRRVLQVRYPTCVVKGCEIPAAVCQIDHVDGWENGQPSDIDRLVMCCAWHNKYKWRHPGRVIITQLRDGRYQYRVRQPGRDRPPDRPSGPDP